MSRTKIRIFQSNDALIIEDEVNKFMNTETNRLVSLSMQDTLLPSVDSDDEDTINTTVIITYIDFNS